MISDDTVNRAEDLLGDEYKGKLICVPINFTIQLLTREETAIPEAIDYLVEEVAKKDDYWIVVAYQSEGFGTKYLKIIDKIVKELITKHGVDYNRIMFMCSAAYVEFNRKNYYKYCIENDHLPLQICYTNEWERQQSCYAVSDPEVVFSTNPNPEKKFLFFNRHLRPHRLFLIGELIKRNILEQSYYSLYESPEELDQQLKYAPDKFLPGVRAMVSDYVYSLRDRMPINLTMNDELTNQLHVGPDDVKLYNNSLFSLITETVFLNNIDCSDPEAVNHIHCYPGPFYTEKTWKAFKAKHPFIIASTPYTVQSLTELGYKTFHPYINESYDSIENDVDRLYAIADEVERLCNMTESERIEWIKNVQPICEYNFQHLKDRGMVTRFSWE